MVGVCAFLGMFASCDEKTPIDNGGDENNGGTEVTTSLSVAAINPTSATFVVKDLAIDSLAYYVHEGEVAEDELDPIVLFAEAQEEGRIVAVANDSCTFSVYSLEGDKEYTVYIVYTEGDQFATKSTKFTTTSYDRIITVVESKKDGYKFHFNVPEDMVYRYAFLLTEWYNSARLYYHHNDIGFLEDGRVAQGPQTVEINAGDDWLEGDGTDWYIHPGSAYTLLIAECDEEGNLLWEKNPDWEEPSGDDMDGGILLAPATRAGTTVAPRQGAYTETAWFEDDAYPTGLYARQDLLAALDMVESKVKVELTGKTERRIKIRCTADEDVQYVVAPMEMNLYNEYVSLVNEEAIASCLLEIWGSEAQSGTQDFELDENYLFPLGADSTYVISVIGVYAEDASVISYDTLHVTLTKSTLPAAELTITGCENPEGEPTPNLVWFNVKSEKKNVYAAKHIANYTKEVAKMLNQGYTHEDLITYYGEYLTEEDIQAINSDEGLNLSLLSMEDAATTLIIAAFNEEESMSFYTGESRSASLPTLEPVNSTLFEDLKDEWTARIICKKSEYNYETWEYEYSIDTVYTVLTLGETFDNSPESFGTSHEYYKNVYNSIYENELEKGYSEKDAARNAAKQIAAQFSDYKDMVKKYEEKYKNQNYILGLGFAEAHTYATPWELFCASNYTAYDVEELFYVYGPKLFFQVQQDGSLRLLGDATLMNLPPVAAWGWYEFVVVGNNPEDESDVYNGSFPVEISEDKDTLVIKGVEDEGSTYYPAIGFYDGWSMNYMSGGFQTIEDIILTRGALVKDEPENEVENEDVAVATRAAKADFNRTVKSRNNRIKRTYLPTEAEKVKTTKMVCIPVIENIKAKYNK